VEKSLSTTTAGNRTGRSTQVTGYVLHEQMGSNKSLKYSALRIDMSQSMTHEHFTLIGHHHHPKKKLLFVL
jgi:hypothetical protein